MILRDIDNIPDLFVIPSIKKIDSKLLIVSNSRIQNYTTIDSIIDLFVVFAIYIYICLFVLLHHNVNVANKVIAHNKVHYFKCCSNKVTTTLILLFKCYALLTIYQQVSRSKHV